jgi:lysyl-tRNA synthetase class I
MRGDEKIHIGIRPYQMHDGNTLAIVAYPILLCEEIIRLGKTPRFNFIVSFNDWEQDSLTGEDIYKYHFDVEPNDTTIEFLKEENGIRTVEYWGPQIQKSIIEIKKMFSEVSIKIVYNSDLKNNKVMKSVILKTIKERKELKALLLKTTGCPTTGSDTRFANAVCPNCLHINTDTEVLETDMLKTNCKKCYKSYVLPYQDCSYWIYHKPLFIARWEIFGFTHCISGGDHYIEGDAKTRESLYEFYFDKKNPEIDMLFSPILLGKNKAKMSKSRQNYFTTNLRTVLDAARLNKTEIIDLIVE